MEQSSFNSFYTNRHPVGGKFKLDEYINDLIGNFSSIQEETLKKERIKTIQKLLNKIENERSKNQD